MSFSPQYQHQFDTLKCCVLIPTYNNGNTLAKVLDGVLNYTNNVVVVNDGSTDCTHSVLQKYKNIKTLSLPKNKGKGNALKIGFRKAAESGYKYAVTMDSDGQHYPDDLPVFIEALKKQKPEEAELLIIGAREMDAPGVPGKSSVGNRFSSFWYWVETGIKLKDTQCGYRLYPLEVVNSLSLYTSRFELEIEVIVKAAWKGVDVKNLPVKVLYDPAERVTHFRPFQDVTRITLLNIWFVGVAYFYIFPRNFLRKIFGSKNVVKKSPFSEVSLPFKDENKF